MYVKLNALRICFQAMFRPQDRCAKLKCKVPGKLSNVFTTKSSPALDGTDCGEDMVS